MKRYKICCQGDDVTVDDQNDRAVLIVNSGGTHIAKIAAQALDLYDLTGKTPFELMSEHCPVMVAEWCRDVNKKADNLYPKMKMMVNDEINPDDVLILESKLDAIAKILEPEKD